MDDYLNWQEYNGTRYHERADALSNIFERNIIKARYSWAISRLQKSRMSYVLDVGCGLGYGSNLIFNAGFEVEGIDKSKDAIEICRKRYPHIKFILGNFPQNIDYKYDAIVANEIIEHVPDCEIFVKDCMYVLNPNGILLITTPNRKYTKHQNPHHAHEFTFEEIKKLFPKSRIRGLLSLLMRGQGLMLLFMSKVQVHRLMLEGSFLPIFHHLPQYSRYFLVEVTKSD